MSALVVNGAPVLSFPFHRPNITALHEALLCEAMNAVESPRAAGEDSEWRRRFRQGDVVNPVQLCSPRNITESNAEGAIEEKGIHDAIVRSAITNPAQAHLLDIEFVPA
jgi:hypothetical protein